MHDFNKFPELTNNQMRFYYLESPHTQIFDNFSARVTKVKDGDTVNLECDFRNFNFPLRISMINAPEMNEGGAESKEWLKNEILGKEVEIIINRSNRVGKFGRLIGEIICGGINIGRQSLQERQSIPFGTKKSFTFDWGKFQ